jgi:hypothetical protein
LSGGSRKPARCHCRGGAGSCGNIVGATVKATIRGVGISRLIFPEVVVSGNAQFTVAASQPSATLSAHGFSSSGIAQPVSAIAHGNTVAASHNPANSAIRRRVRVLREERYAKVMMWVTIAEAGLACLDRTSRVPSWRRPRWVAFCSKHLEAHMQRCQLCTPQSAYPGRCPTKRAHQSEPQRGILSSRRHPHSFRRHSAMLKQENFRLRPSSHPSTGE